MDYVKLSEMSSKEFRACFISLSAVDRMKFVSNRRNEIFEVKDIDILLCLCFNGYADAMLPIIRFGSKNDILKGFEYVYSPKANLIRLNMSKENELKVLDFAANNIYVADFMYNQIHFLSSVKTKGRWIETVIFQKASSEVLEFLFNNLAKDRIIISRAVGDVLIEKCSIDCIKRYVKRVRFLGVRQSYFTTASIKKLYQRNDLSSDDKRELTYFLINRLKFAPNAVSKIRKQGFID